MITEDYVSFETAKLLKDKGFDIPCRSNYRSKYKDCKVPFYHSAPKNFNGKEYEGLSSEWFSAPTLQMVMKWLREIHNLNIIFDMLPKGNDCYVLWTFNIVSNKNYKTIWGLKQPKYKTYEEAAEEAIKYCLENLI